MRQLNGLYTQRYNKRHARVGHLLQGRFKAILVEKEAHLLELCRYVVMNPVRAKIVDHPAKWPWSTYRAILGLAPVPLYLTIDWILGQFGSRLHDAQLQYQAFVLRGKDIPSPWDKLRGQLYLGSEEFIAKHHPDRLIPEIPRRQSMAQRPELNELFNGQQNLEHAIMEAYKRYGYRLSEIAKHLNVHYATISRHLRRAENKNV